MGEEEGGRRANLPERFLYAQLRASVTGTRPVAWRGSAKFNLTIWFNPGTILWIMGTHGFQSNQGKEKNMAQVLGAGTVHQWAQTGFHIKQSVHTSVYTSKQSVRFCVVKEI